MLKELGVKLNKPSIIVIIASICFVIVTMDLWRSWHNGQHQISWDVANYYSYLPATFNNNGSFEFEDDLKNYLPVYPGDSLHMPKTTYGMALLYSPFYAIGHKIAINQGNKLNGFTDGYTGVLHWGMIFYGIIGLIVLRRFLIEFYSEKVVAITIGILFFGTSLFYYSVSQPEMSHAGLFFLFSCFLWFNYKWHLKQTYGTSIILGLIIGAIVLIRPTDIIIVLLLIFWPLSDKFNLIEKVKFFLKNYFKIAVMIVMAFLIWLPQLVFWKSRTGHYFYFSYPGEQFFWGDPQIVNVLFSYRKGLFIYTPLILLSVIGFFFMNNKSRSIKTILIVISILNLYIISCWWDWFYGGCFAARAFVQHFAYLSIPLAAFISYFFEKAHQLVWMPLLKLLVVIIISFGVSLNLAQTYQYNNNLIHFYAMTKESYWYVFGRFKLQEWEKNDLWSKLKEPNYDKLRSGEDRDQ